MQFGWSTFMSGFQGGAVAALIVLGAQLILT